MLEVGPDQPGSPQVAFTKVNIVELGLLQAGLAQVSEFELRER